MKLGAILVFSIITLMIVPAYGDVTSLKTDKSVYSIGDKIVFFGTSNNPGEFVHISIKNSFGNTVEFKSGIVNSAGDFSLFPITVDNKKFDKPGTFQVIAFGDTERIENGTRLTLDFSNDKITVLGLFDLKLSTISNKNIDEEKTLSFTVTVTDSTIEDLQFSLDNNPPGTTINPTTGQFTWTPNDAQGGITYTFDVVVNVGELEDRKTITITVKGVPPPTPKPQPTPELTPEPKETGIASFVDPKQDPQYYINRYNNEETYKDWFDKNYPNITIYEAVGLENPEPPKELAPFVDPKQDPQYYINRYNNEETYKDWFDKNYPNITIYEAVGIEEPEFGECGVGTKLIDGVCTVIKSSQGGGCLIATATYGSELAPQVQMLREIRDNSLLQTQSGQSFMQGFNQFYYSFSPTIADYERENPVFKEAVKVTITPLVASLSLLNYVDLDSEESVLGYGIGIILMNIGMYFVAPAIVIFRIKNR
ncbi:MAG: Ig domain-containing protein [Nitrosopumilaceae archaeon]